MRHALVVGGTGMLRDVSKWLLQEGYLVSIIARNADRMNQLINSTTYKEKVVPILVDYKNDQQLQEKVRATIEENGEIDTVVAWIHSDAPQALTTITKEVCRKKKEWELFHVLGSSSDLSKIKQRVNIPVNCSYHQIQLGFVMENGRSRWLTNQEISAGVIQAIKDKNSKIVGQLEPWKMRP